MTKAGIRNQFLGTFLANLVVIGCGASNGWTSPTIPLLQSDDTPLTNGPLNDDQISWIGSLICVGGLFGAFLFGWICDKYGRRASIISMAIPQIVSWVFILVGSDVSYLYVSRFIAGLAAGGAFVATPLYISEIAETRVRGALGSIVIFAENIGMVLMYIAGSFLNYHWIPWIFTFFPIASILGLLFVPETPFYLVKMGDTSAAEKALKFYWGVELEINDRNTIMLEMIALMGNGKSHTDNNKTGNDKIKLSDFTSRHAKRALFLGIIIVIFNQFSGVFAMQSYTASVFEKSGSSLSPNNSAIVVGFIQICGNYCATITVERLGRKFCMVISTIGIALGYAAMGTYTLLDTLKYDLETFKWIPLVAFSFIIFIASVGVSTVIFVVLSEIMPEKIKEFASTLCVAILWSCAFIVAKIFPLLINLLQMYGAMSLFTAINVASAVLLMILQPETKGKSFAEIKRIFEK